MKIVRMSAPEIDLNRLGTGTGTRSPLLLWMIDHHDDMTAMIQRHRINWETATQRFTEAGFRSGRDRPLTPRGVRACWTRARKFVASHPPVRVSSPAPQPPPPLPPPVSRHGFDPIEPEITPDDLFDKPLPTVRFRHQQSKSGIVATAERSANDAKTALAPARAKPPPAKE
jgi:hypothetical protein